MEPLNIPVTNPDGTATSVNVFGSANADSAPIIIIFPAMGIRAKTYAPLAAAMAAKGYTSVTADLRGKGLSSVRPSKKVDFGYREMVEQDIHSVVSAIRAQYPDRQVYLLGHSLGGQLACLYTARAMSVVDGLILIACCSVYYKGWDGMSKFRILMGTQFIGLLSTVVGYFPGRRVGFGGTNSKSMMQDWSRQSRTGRYELNNDDFNYEEGLRSLTLPVLTISFEGDNFSPLKAVKHLCGKFNEKAPVREVHLAKDDPLNERYNHFNWPKKPDSIVRIIGEWLGEHHF